MSTAAWLIDAARTNFDTASAEALLDTAPDAGLGRFACGLCADNRDATREGLRGRAKRPRTSLLRLILRAGSEAGSSPEGLEDDRTAQALLGHVAAWAIPQGARRAVLSGRVDRL